MKMKSLTLENFGVYEKKVFPLENVMVILDKNGAGKSTFLKALNYALCGEYDETMLRNGCTEMSVTLEFDSGFRVVRKRKGNINSAKMGFEQVRTATKEAVNNEIARLCNSPMDSIRVIASSRELFDMKPEVLADFFMKHIPNKMTTDMVIRYISDITDSMKEEIVKILPDKDPFGQDMILQTYDSFEANRKDYAKQVKQIKGHIDKYDFQKTYRDVKEINEEVTSVLKNIGAMEEKKKAFEQYEQMKIIRNNNVNRIENIKKVYGTIQAVRPDPEKLQILETEKRSLQSEYVSVSNAIAAARNSIAALERIIDSLKKGMCPQIKGFHCTHDWSGQIQEFLSQKRQLESEILSLKESLNRILVKQDKNEHLIQDYQSNEQNFREKVRLYEEYTKLKEGLIELPEKPEVPTADYEKRRMELQKELEESILYEKMLQEKQLIPVLTEKLKTYESLCKCFSKKGEILEKNLEYYVTFFEDRINEKAEKLGYIVKLSSDSGLHVYIGKEEEQLVSIDKASKGETAIAIFLLLDVLNSITGIRLLFLDELEILDGEVFKALCTLIQENKSEYDHIIMAGVDHMDTVAIVKETIF